MSTRDTPEKILLVDPDDKPMGEMEKMLVHQYGMLHRAFSVLVFRERHGELQTLIQQRNQHKYHCGGLWTNACCSHPHAGETLKNAAEARLLNEMGIEVSLSEAGKFHYIATFDNGLTENEIDHVFVGRFEDDVMEVNPLEVDDYRWVGVEALKADLVHSPGKYTPWFLRALEIALNFPGR